MKLIVFLGNPGKQYAWNRHNIGFIAGDLIADRHGISVSKKEFSSLTGKSAINDEQLLFLFPQTYMNKSGEAVVQAMQFYKLTLEDLIVVHDELELSFGDIRIKKGGGHKGHNGIRSIAAQSGSPDFYRIRFGIGRPENSNVKVADYVLSDFSTQEKERLEELCEKVYNLIIEILG